MVTTMVISTHLKIDFGIVINETGSNCVKSCLRFKENKERIYMTILIRQKIIYMTFFIVYAYIRQMFPSTSGEKGSKVSPAPANSNPRRSYYLKDNELTNSSMTRVQNIDNYRRKRPFDMQKLYSSKVETCTMQACYWLHRVHLLAANQQQGCKVQISPLDE